MLRCAFLLCWIAVVFAGSGQQGVGAGVGTGAAVGPSGSGNDPSGSGSGFASASGSGSGQLEKSAGTPTVAARRYVNSPTAIGGNSSDKSGGESKGKNEVAPSSAASNVNTDCSTHFQNVADCLVESFKQSDARVKDQFDKKKTELESCFTSNKCKVPTPPKDSSDSQMDQCGKAVFEKMRSQVQDCVKQKFPNLKLPDMKINRSLTPHLHPGKFCGALNDFCPADVNRTALVLCLQKTFEGEVVSIKKDHEKFCRDDMLCLRKIPQPCQSQFFDVKEQVQNCMADTRDKNITANIPECQNQSPKAGGSGDHCSSGMALPHHGVTGKSQQSAKTGNKFNICGSFQDFQRANFDFHGGDKAGREGGMK